jgi:nitroreductase
LSINNFWHFFGIFSRFTNLIQYSLNLLIMKKKIVGIFVLCLVLTLATSAQNKEIIPLPEPDRSGGMSLLEALSNRSSSRTFSAEALSEKHLSGLLWAASGVNREDGRRTAPTARNWQQIDIYLIMAGGWYLYDHKEHALIKQGAEDFREHAGSQDYVSTAPLNLIYVSDHDRMTGADEDNRKFHSATDVGFVSQNVYLYCASEEISTVVRGLLDRDKLHGLLKLGPSQHVILGQTVGYPGQ